MVITSSAADLPTPSSFPPYTSTTFYKSLQASYIISRLDIIFADLKNQVGNSQLKPISTLPTIKRKSINIGLGVRKEVRIHKRRTKIPKFSLAKDAGNITTSKQSARLYFSSRKTFKQGHHCDSYFSGMEVSTNGVKEFFNSHGIRPNSFTSQSHTLTSRPQMIFPPEQNISTSLIVNLRAKAHSYSTPTTAFPFIPATSASTRTLFRYAEQQRKREKGPCLQCDEFNGAGKPLFNKTEVIEVGDISSKHAEISFAATHGMTTKATFGSSSGAAGIFPYIVFLPALPKPPDIPQKAYGTP